MSATYRILTQNQLDNRFIAKAVVAGLPKGTDYRGHIWNLAKNYFTAGYSGLMITSILKLTWAQHNCIPLNATIESLHAEQVVARAPKVNPMAAEIAALTAENANMLLAENCRMLRAQNAALRAKAAKAAA